ncbi:glycosyltransferase [Shimia biformata]|uniref:glycosyltransferase n=1 Tax=Shimia biformata TaxID=1294299 RepID=UPI001950FA97|nr:glycosyltransferase [Shimia biformata]
MSLGIVVIGRNEGARLLDCLDSLASAEAPVIYVDSGSSDNSVADARARGVMVVELDPTTPFTAARGRNAGVDALRAADTPPEFIQFFDGDCIIEPGWIATGLAAMEADPELGLVTGWRTEIHPDASIYNAICDVEWRRPAGEIAACGGDMLVRASAFGAAGGFDPRVIAAEDDEFCVRLAKAGWKLRRFPVKMTRHDAAMTQFAEWWQRARRSGHGFAQVGDMHPSYFIKERARVVIYGLLMPFLFVLGLIGPGWLSGLVLAGYGVSYLRGVRGLIVDGLPMDKAWRQGVFLTLSKFPNAIGFLQYYWRKWTKAAMRIIEYK